MRKKLLLLFLLLTQILQAQEWEINSNNRYNSLFQEAYVLYPAIPKGILESIAYTNTHIRHIQPENEAPSCSDLPQYFGVMGLVDNGKGYFRENLKLVAQLSGFSENEIKRNPRTNILAFAKAYETLRIRLNIDSKIKNQYPILLELSELPKTTEKNEAFIFDTYAYSVFKNLNAVKFQNTHQLPQYEIDLKLIFGDENLKVLEAKKVIIENNRISNPNGNNYNPTNSRFAPPCGDVSGSFPYTVLSAPADPSNYSSRSGTTITHVTIHTMQGTYAGAISWFQNPSANVSAHYNIRASDGQITQSVCEIDKAWHVSNSNPYAIGIEHEGYIADPTWYTNVMYTVSAELTKDIASRRSINLIRTYDHNGDNGLNPLSDGCFKIKGHQHFPSQTHVDPGEFWDWNKYYDLLNPATSTPTNIYTACSGTFYDTGGSSGNYGNDERNFYLIKPTGAGSVSIDFTSLNLETNYDYLYIYDGESYNDPLIATLNGTTLPGTITATSGKMLLEFRTDCATVASGWIANWSCNMASPICEEPTNLNEINLTHNQATLDWDDVPSAQSYEVKFKHILASSWQTFTTNNSYLDVTGLAADGHYLWQVRTNCGSGNYSQWAGTEFTNTNAIVNTTTTLCEGTFTDTGSDIGGYRNNESYNFTIAPTGASTVTLTFSSFDTETNYDFLKIYDGPSTASTLLGTYSGTTIPPTITSSGPSLTIRFTSDTATTRPGWVANWSCCKNPTITSLTASDNSICASQTVTLNINGSLNDATLWAIYSGSCGGTLVGTTNSNTFDLTPSVTTTYFVRGIGGCPSTQPCTSITINVGNPEIDVLGNSISIVNNDVTPSTTDDTDFGTVSTNTTNTFTIDNSGIDNLIISDITLSGVDATDFSISGITLPVTITSGNSITFDVNFIIGTSGTKNATVTIDNNDCDESSYSFAIRATSGCGNTTTWNGSSWSNGSPSLTKAVVFIGNYSSTASILACNVLITNNAQVTFNSGHTLIIDNEITVDTGSLLTIENNSALRQVNDNAVNYGNIIVKRYSAPMIRLDYTAWGSPVENQQLQAFSPNTLSNRFYEYLYTGTTTATAFQSVNPTTNFEVGKGYLIRVDNTWPATTPTAYNGTFNGVPANGIYSKSVGLGYNLLSNPFPSPISGNSFLGQNPSIDALYFWTHTVPSSGGSYPSNNYASYTTLGGTASASGSAIPNGTIAVGQGFYVNKTGSAGTANFKNNQRVNASVSTQFFRTSEETETHRFWINLNSVNQPINQILIGYTENATNSLDNQIDGRMLDQSKTMLYSIVNNENLVIQGRALPFTSDDVVTLGFKATEKGTFEISLEMIDGLFADQDIYLKDKAIGYTHNLKENKYSFISEAGEFENRFEIVYKKLTSQLNEITNNEVFAYSNNEIITVNSNNKKIDKIEVYDILGRKLFESKNVNHNSFSINSILKENQPLLVKIHLENDEIHTKKIIH
ncbi:MAG: choice-of-anchor D domain-containing protein [Flavobacterium sp.]|nr:choice-of-anchor D domain-containing protein [Flavobacterium sp.]